MGITHSKVSAKSDGGDATLIRPSDWNDEHVISGLSPAFIGVAAYNSSNLAMSTSGEGNLTMNSELFDTDGFHDLSTNSQRFTVPAGLGGRYLIGVSTRISGSNNSYLIARIDGSTIVFLANSLWNSSNSFGTAVATSVVDLAAGQYVEFKQLANGAQDIVNSAGGGPQVWAYMVKLDSGKVGAGIGALARSTAAQTLSDATWTAVALPTSEDFDTDGFHDLSTNNSRMTIPAGLGGKYLCRGGVVHNQTNAGARYVALRKNGTVVTSISAKADQLVHHSIEVVEVLNLAAGDYVEVYAYQDSGGNNDLLSGSSLSIMRLDSGSSGGKSYVTDPGLRPPDSAATGDIEFLSHANATDPTAAPGMSWGNQGSATGTITSGRLVMNSATTTGLRALLVATPGSGNFDVTTCVGSFAYVDTLVAGLVMLWGTPGTPTNIRGAGFYWNASIATRTQYVWTTYNTSWAATADVAAVLSPVPNLVYLRLAWDGTNLVYSVSYSGLPGTFATITSQALGLGRPDYIGLGVNTNGATPAAIAAFNFLRFDWSADFDPTTDN